MGGRVGSGSPRRPTVYGDIAGVLRRSKPSGGLRFDRERWPDLNEEDEETVRRALEEVPRLPHDAACEAVVRLEREHGGRRDAVWARLGLSPMADVLRPLASLATAARLAVGGTEPADVASAYLERGWQADRGAWEALAGAPVADEGCIAAAVRHLLEPWLDESARAFQAACRRHSLPGRGAQPAVDADEDGCILFADGLRFDLALGLADRLEGRGFRIDLRRRWAALPTVTGTAKPAVTPVAEEVAGDVLDQTFSAQFHDSRKPADASSLRSAMRARGYQILGGESQDAPSTHPARGWLETGEFDRLGHDLGAARFAHQLGIEIERLAERIAGLLDAGWTAVRVVTDHGWLLLPGGLPKVDLPKHLTESRWARCAVIAGEAAPDVPRTPWHWNPAQWFATTPGIACFNKSEEYAHGGLSIQECLIPDLVVTRAGDDTMTATITSLTWRGLRCFVEAEVRGGPVTADLRLERPSGESAAATPKTVDPNGTISLVLADDEYEAAAAGARAAGRSRPRAGSPADPRGSGCMTEPVALDRPRQARRGGVSGLPGAQGPRPALRTAIPGSDVRRRVPARPLLRERRRAGDRGGTRHRRAAVAGPDRPYQRSGNLQVAGRGRMARSS